MEVGFRVEGLTSHPRISNASRAVPLLGSGCVVLGYGACLLPHETRA